MILFLLSVGVLLLILLTRLALVAAGGPTVGWVIAISGIGASWVCAFLATVMNAILQ